ncbi:TPA: phage baseplate assembly protein [Burkholderia contaminans]|uniref:phage baseplate assembly protein n=1 Tax=Burkholderia contaminans TaxID=488447 RepID=UPI000CFF5DF4|nr:Mu P family protein [Burkholderia contaminans]HDR9065474.1 Mu P family protein [Burkholderia vietnamiensis]MBM6427913.1 Mu P family protein [Burkholderia contaminans]MCA7876744.1 Mu P family protein [Burkholderia contaminans]MDN8024233.1 Mu P family protein [Burkholderia contaminans]PRG14361.1 Mu P family protein [Burkholderia contaminans]
MGSDEITLTVGGQTVSGWTDVRITRGVERMPSDFDIGLTELYPGELDQVVVTPGDPCVVNIGLDTVITGYVDRYIPSYDLSDHRIRIVGRGKCQDLIDCSAEWENGQISGASALAVASKLAAPYGITASCAETGLRVIPQFNLMLGETPFEIIDRVARYSALLAYEDVDGNLVLARASTDEHASGFEEGKNVEAASVEYSCDQRFQTYRAYLQAINTFKEGGDGGNLIATTTDSGVLRNRKKFIIAEAVAGYMDVAAQRAAWEMNRRNGRSIVVRLVVDSWRDSGGDLWAPNRLVSVYLPKLKLDRVAWLISEVTYRLDESGTHAELVIMSPDAFAIEPTALLYGFVDGSTLGVQ